MPATPADPEGIYHYHNFPQFIAEQQSLLEFGTWIHSKGEIIGRIALVTYEEPQASATC